MSTTYEGQYVVNSFYAINADTGEPITANDKGVIDVAAGTKIVFKNLFGDGFVDVNTLVFITNNDALKVQINDNNTFPFYVEANSRKGISQMRISSFTV